MVNVQPLGDGDPRRLGDYDVTGRLGEGGQGVVYLGRGAAGQVAIKLLHAQLIEDEPARARFVREVEVTKRVARFCTAQVLSVGMAGDRPYIVSEYVPGPSLQRLVRDEGPRRGSALDRLAVNTATALAAIHQAGVVHRDFKPGNVLMGPDGPVVIDFGIARALDASGTMTSAVSQVVGTPAFMAPEQLAEGTIAPHTDMFAWAVTMVYAASGAPAFGHRSIPQVINRILHAEPDLGALDGRLRPAVAACLSKDPSRRPTARQLMDELMGHNVSRSGNPGAAGPSAPSTAPASRTTADPAGAGGLGAAGLGAAGIGGAGGVGSGGAGATERMPSPGSPTGNGMPGPRHPGATMRLPAAGPAPAAGPVSPGGPGTGFPGPPGSPDRRPRRKGRTGLVIGAVAAGLIVLGAGIGALAATNDSDGGAPSNTAAPPPTQRSSHHPVRSRTPSPSRTPSRHPTPRKTVRANPYKPQRLCGSGYRVIETHGLGEARAYLLYNAKAGTNCVVTMVPRSSGKVFLSASLVVKGGSRESRSGSFPFYAGPIRLPARGKCVMWGGASKTAKWTSGWSHCGK
ncbi:serine/threonine protein kinase [Actinoallomurus sp. NBC_01490]|uniref:serine/threonine protein kinase n=1 Tax=Actinoallomurus sp. NBC_01490 TaxID=2903557 RepID=UPI002E3599AD|nr:serine/threonine-protein kinase [Actinoallomurus sp. NBC_01490]